MEQEKLKEQITKYFDTTERQIVFWYDSTGEQEQLLDSLDLPDIKVHKLTQKNNLYTKKLLEHDDLTSNYLVYANFEKPEPQNNWFLDTQLYSKEFSLDEVEILSNDFEVYDGEYKTLIKKHLKFFKNAERKKKFEKILPKKKSIDDFYVTMFTVVLNGKIPEIKKVIQRFLVESLSKNNDVLKEFEKYALQDKFWELVQKCLGYKNEKDDKLLLAGIIFSDLKQLISDKNFPLTFKKYLCDDNADSECASFIESWIRDSELSPYYKELSLMIEQDFNINTEIKDWTEIINNAPDFNLLRAYDEYLKNYLINSFAYLSDDYKQLLEKRRKHSLFIDEYENTYQALYWGIEFNNLLKTTLIPDQKAEAFVKNYTNEYYKIDTAYRKFYYYYKKADDIDLDEIKTSIENAYVNNYLDNLCSKFSKSLSELAPVWNIPTCTMQKDFYFDEIKSLKQKTVVIISDALRYEIAQELKTEIKSDYTIKTDEPVLDFVIGSIPSYTRLGMASLLPHNELKMADSGDIIVDNISSASTENREKILQVKNPKSKAMLFKEFDTTSRENLREIFSGVDIVYIYHNRIDKTGEDFEDEVFDSADNAINEIKEKIKFIFNNSLASNVIVTADHGFLYQNGDVAEHQKITIGLTNSITSSKRFIISNQKMDIDGVMNFNMDYLLTNSDLNASLPYNINRFKTQGGGIKYVHGGASLQEIVVPVLKIKQNRKLEINDVELVLQNGTREIKNRKYKLTFYQNEPVSETVKPRQFRITLHDEEKNVQVSNEIIIDADVKSESLQDRTFSRILELSNYDFEKGKIYKLYVEDTSKVGEPCAKYDFTVNLTFTTDF